MKPYSSYKDSGIEWLGEIPSHWVKCKLKFLGKIRYGLGQPPKELENGIPIIRATNVERGKIVTKDLVYVDPSDVPTGRNAFLEENEIIVVRSGAYTADSAIVTKDYAGAIAGYDMVITPTAINAKLLSFGLLSQYILQNQLFLERMRAAQPHLNAEELGETIIVCPPIPEQKAIVGFLDRKTAQIDTLIAKKQRQIELLQEQHTALINETMSKGQDRNVFYENSPAPWLFSLPIGWGRQKLKLNTYMKGRIGYQNLRSEEYTDEGPLLVSSVHFKNGKIEWDKCNHVTRERFEMAPEIILQDHDVLFMKDGALMGKLAYVDHVPGDACLNSHLLLMRPSNGSYLPRYLYYVLMTDFFEAYMIQKRNGTTFFGFSQESMGNFPMSLPPIDEQKEICHFLDTQTEKVKTAIGKINDAIAGLQEYRTALISEAVTGKIDVR